MKCVFQIEILKCGMAYGSTKLLVQSSSCTTRIVFCSTNVLSVAALNATTSISARHNILSARTPASYTATFEAVATDELQEWCRLLVHPVNGYVTVNHIPAMTMIVDLAYELPLPGNFAKCRPGNLLVRHGT